MDFVLGEKKHKRSMKSQQVQHVRVDLPGLQQPQKASGFSNSVVDHLSVPHVEGPFVVSRIQETTDGCCLGYSSVLRGKHVD